MSFTNFITGESHSFGGTYLELVPHQRICYSDKFDDPNLSGEMTTTITLNKVSVGTDLSIVQDGLPDVIPIETCCLGWQESLVLLAKLVEAEIPDQFGCCRRNSPTADRSSCDRRASDHLRSIWTQSGFVSKWKTADTFDMSSKTAIGLSASSSARS